MKKSVSQNELQREQYEGILYYIEHLKEIRIICLALIGGLITYFCFYLSNYAFSLTVNNYKNLLFFGFACFSIISISFEIIRVFFVQKKIIEFIIDAKYDEDKDDKTIYKEFKDVRRGYRGIIYIFIISFISFIITISLGLYSSSYQKTDISKIEENIQDLNNNFNRFNNKIIELNIKNDSTIKVLKDSLDDCKSKGNVKPKRNK
jgi:uncharacterized BrkB/YihY/UPF0761 family membrane protein